MMAVKRPKTSVKVDVTKSIWSSKINWLSLVVLILVTVISFLVSKFFNDLPSQQQSKTVKPKFWSFWEAKWNPSGNFHTMNWVFERLSYKFVNEWINAWHWSWLSHFNQQIIVTWSTFCQLVCRHRRHINKNFKILLRKTFKTKTWKKLWKLSWFQIDIQNLLSIS